MVCAGAASIYWSQLHFFHLLVRSPFVEVEDNQIEIRPSNLLLVYVTKWLLLNFSNY